MDSNLSKYKLAILYFIQNCNNVYLGEVKLNKLLYYLDFLSYRDNNKSVTKETYIKNHFGPTPQNITTELQELIQDEYITKKKEDHRDSHKTSFNLQNKANKIDYGNLFSKDEVVLLKKICETFKNWNTSMIVDQTHLEAPWFYSDFGQKIDFELSKSIDIIGD
ncbi:MAG: Panacea domain-containing protein [Candidatus Saccharibacteria bacterium]|nr:Panacea domain-containing protein [Candidatus Saccharibacteria bacterium]